MGIFGWDGYAGSTADSKKIVGPQLLVSSPDLCSSSYYYPLLSWFALLNSDIIIKSNFKGSSVIKSQSSN